MTPIQTEHRNLMLASAAEIERQRRFLANLEKEDAQLEERIQQLRQQRKEVSGKILALRQRIGNMETIFDSSLRTLVRELGQ